ncbi:hypothetical protein [Nisaea denitrificans]|uniref:hypothetical protein n=1 Tax=Nisaea denitrificans TaxID=390877 RepID=UPI00041EC22B|nr:hypothetical protein [Nisaea denitrificans]
MSKAILIFSVIFVFAVALGAIFPAGAETYRPINQRPMFGNIQKTQEMLDADAAFRASVKQKGYTDEQAYEHFVKRGWQYFNSGDLGGAVRRFNQAWLLMPEKSSAYHGFALARVVQQAPLSEIDQLFEIALSKEDLSAGTLSDYARFLNLSGRPRHAITQAERALAMDGNVYNARNQMAAAYLSLGERALGCEWARRARSAGESYVPEAEFQATCGD